MKNQSTQDLSKTEEKRPIPEGDKYKPKSCLNCGTTVEPRSFGIFWQATEERCPECLKIHWGKIRIAEEERLRKININKIIENCGLDKRQYLMEFDNYNAESLSQKKALNKLKAYEYDPDNPQNVLLYGSSGVGKTHLVVSLAKQIVRNNLKDLKFITDLNLINRIKAEFSSWGSPQDVIGKLSDVPLLILDDLGTVKSTEWSVETIYCVVDNRYTKMFPTFVTSNYSPDELTKKFHDRLVSRLLENVILMKIEGDDYRIKRKEDKNV